MSRTGEEMISELSKLLGTDSVVKTAEKKDKEDKEEKKEDKEEDDKEDKEDKKKEKKKSKKKKAEVLSGVVSGLVKMANELDAAGNDEAANLVDDALQVIMKNIDKE